MSKIIILVSCVNEKDSVSRPAHLLYTSDWFKKTSQYADQNSDNWFILSALYYLVHPDQIIKPYDLTLKSMGKEARRNWAVQVWTMLSPFLSPSDKVVFLAGKIYRENLIEPIRCLNCSAEIPMEGLRIGEQKHWLLQHLGGD